MPQTKDSTYKRKPSWLKVNLKAQDNFFEIKKELRSKNLHTVCEEARCPNISECWENKTATMMILGDTCTRACKFCDVKTGNPKGFLDPDEITSAAKMVGLMSLRYIVITSVDRDDLPDFGANHFAQVVSEVHKEHPDTKVEVLIPDFESIPEHMHTLAKSNPFVIAQNIETVKRLTHPVRDRRAGYQKTLDCLNFYKKEYPHIKTKSSIMVGLGENWDELLETMDDLLTVGVDVVTFGQYLRPSKRLLNVEEYYTPEMFQRLKEIALIKGFQFVASGPLVRSSYKASDFLDYLNEK